MSCTNKMLAQRNNKTGEVKFIGAVSSFSPEKIKSLLNLSSNSNYTYLKLPCGQCIGCRLDRAHQWAVRCMHEAKTSTACAFITLTFGEEQTYEYFRKKGYSKKEAKLKTNQLIWSLDVGTFQKFMKRLRKKVAPLRVRFFHVGEYGTKKCRAHHHALIFGYDFPDKIKHSYKKLENGQFLEYYISPMLSKLWPFGFHIIGDVTQESADYCARYCTKKVNGQLKDSYYNGRKPEYLTMSRNPGIGYEWFKMYGMTDVYPQDFMLDKKKHKVRPARYYDKLFDIENPEEFAKIKAIREMKAKEISLKLDSKTVIDDTKERKEALEYNNDLKLKRLVRCLEDDNLSDFKFIEFINKCSAFGIPRSVYQRFIDKGEEYGDDITSAVNLANQYLDCLYGKLDYTKFENKSNKRVSKEKQEIHELYKKIKEL